MYTELLIYTIVAGAFSIFLFMRRRLYSGALLGLATLVLGYIVLVTIYKYDVSITTMPWPVSDAELTTMASIVFIFTVIFFTTNLIINSIIINERHELSVASKTIPRKNEKIMFFWAMSIGILLLLLTADGWWVFVPYPESKNIWSDYKLGGSGFLVLLAFVYSYKNGITLGGRYKGTSVVVILLVCGHFILAGDRGSLLFILVGISVLYYLEADEGKRRRLVWTAVPGLAAIIYFMNEMSNWRSWGESIEVTGLAEYSSDIDLLPQALAHLNHSLVIVSTFGTHFDSMISFFGQFWLQIIPGFILKNFGVELYDGPWRLADYIQHGGGFFVPAEMYFVGGYLGVISISIYFASVSVINDRILSTVYRVGVDRALRRGDVALASLSLGAIPYSFFYGLQAFHRMLLLPTIFIILWSFLKRANNVRRYKRLGQYY